MKKTLLIAFLTAGLVGTVQANLVTFNFNDLSAGTDATDIGNYMTGLYGPSVTVSPNIVVGTNSSLGGGLSPWTGNTTSFIWSGADHVGTLDIYFATPITQVEFDGWVFKASGASGDPDFQVKAFAAGSSTPVYTQIWDTSAGTTVHAGPIDFAPGQPVDHLWFSDNGAHWIGVDNLVVQAVPLPTSILLGVFAVGLAGRKLRQFV